MVAMGGSLVVAFQDLGTALIYGLVRVRQTTQILSKTTSGLKKTLDAGLDGYARANRSGS